mgnify:CR=1 FL=1
MTIKEILNNLYPEEDAIKAESCLVEFGIYDHFFSCLNAIISKLKVEEEEIEKYGSLQIGAVVACLLSGINEKLKDYKVSDEKSIVENVSADVSNSIFQFVIKGSKSDTAILIKQIAVSLHDTCSILKYDEPTLMKLFNFKEKVDLAEIIYNKEKFKVAVNPQEIRFYHWCGDVKLKQIFLSLFFEKKIVKTKSKNDFYKLFGPLSEKLAIEFEPENIRLTITIFHYLYSKKLLRSSGDGGFYKPLKQHILGFETDILKNKTPGEYIDKLKKSTHEWTANISKIEKWFSKFM